MVSSDLFIFAPYRRIEIYRVLKLVFGNIDVIDLLLGKVLTWVIRRVDITKSWAILVELFGPKNRTYRLKSAKN